MFNVLQDHETKPNKPLQHLPLKEAVKVHAVLVVCIRSSTQIVMDRPCTKHKKTKIAGKPYMIWPTFQHKKHGKVGKNQVM